MEDQQQYQMNFSVPGSFGSKTMCFLEVQQIKVVVNEEILKNSETSQQTF